MGLKSDDLYCLPKVRGRRPRHRLACPTLPCLRLNWLAAKDNSHLVRFIACKRYDCACTTTRTRLTRWSHRNPVTHVQGFAKDPYTSASWLSHTAGRPRCWVRLHAGLTAVPGLSSGTFRSKVCFTAPVLCLTGHYLSRPLQKSPQQSEERRQWLQHIPVMHNYQYHSLNPKKTPYLP